MFLSEITVTNN